MRWLNSDLAWLLLLVLVPVLIHLLIRQRLPEVRWAAMTFLLQALRKNRRKLLLETILLLIVRTAIVLAIVLVILRPVIRAGWQWLNPQQQRTVSVIVLDDSASMAASDGVRTRLDRGISRLEEYLDALPDGSETAVILASKPITDLIRQPTRDMHFIRQELNRLTARDGTSDIAAAITRAADRLATVTSPAKEMIIVTDAQAANWQRDRAKIESSMQAAADTGPVFLFSLPNTSPANVTIKQLSVASGTDGLVSDLATTLWPTTISATVEAMHHDEPLETVLELFVDGQKIARREITVTPGNETVTTFEHRFNTAGEHVITVRCTPDLFDRDNERSMMTHVRDQIDVLMVDGRTGEEIFASATGFLRIAMWPTDPADPEAIPLFDARVVSAAEMDTVVPSDFQLIVLADVPALPITALTQIKRAVRDGAGLMVIAGPQVDGASLSSMFAEAGKGPLPIELGEPLDLAPEAEPIGLTLVEPIVPALAGFEDPSLARGLSRAGWRRLRPVAKIQGDSAQIWAYFNQGQAALVANRYGRGRVIYFGGTMDRQGGEFPLSPAFVPFIQQLAFYLIQIDRKGFVEAGSELSWPITAAEAHIIYPDGSREPAGIPQGAPALADDPRTILPAANRAGVYTLEYDNQAGVPQRLRVAVNIASDESDPAMLSLESLSQEKRPTNSVLVSSEEPIQDALRPARTGIELSGIGIIVLLALLAVELLLVRVFMPKQVDTEALLNEAMRI